MKLSKGSLWFLLGAVSSLIASGLIAFADQYRKSSGSAPMSVDYLIGAVFFYILSAASVVIGIVLHLRRPKS